MHYHIFFLFFLLANLFFILSFVPKLRDVAAFPFLAMIHYAICAIASLKIEYPFRYFNATSSTAEEVIFTVRSDPLAYYCVFMSLLMLVYIFVHIYEIVGKGE